jgi:stress-induced morphogen
MDAADQIPISQRTKPYPRGSIKEPEAMPMSRTDLETCLREAFPDAEIELTDLAGDNDHWKAAIASSAFAGKSRVAQHQMVYAALKGQMGGVLHALALETRAK